jgi:hypothetical protein
MGQSQQRRTIAQTSVPTLQDCKTRTSLHSFTTAWQLVEKYESKAAELPSFSEACDPQEGEVVVDALG